MLLNEDNLAEVAEWCGGKVVAGGVEVFIGMPMGGSHYHVARVGDWIAKRVDGNIFARRHGEFGYTGPE